MVRVLEEYAKEHNIPIMLPDGIKFLTDYIKKHNIKSILEIGSAIGYSAIKMALVDKDILITTLERDKERYDEAVINIHNFNLEKQIDIKLVDALDIDLIGEFDLIFIDAAKSQYIKFFEKFKNNLNPNGVIISDNLDFHGLTKEANIVSRNLRQLVRKINEYIVFLKENKEFKTEFISIGDGIGISQRNQDIC